MTGQNMLDFKNWAVVGDVLNQSKYAYKIAAKLEREGYNVFKVNPKSDSIEVYKALKDIKEKVDVIDLVIHPKVGINVVKEAKEVGINKILIQPGAESEEIIDYCNQNDIEVFQGCVLLELAKK